MYNTTEHYRKKIQCFKKRVSYFKNNVFCLKFYYKTYLLYNENRTVFNSFQHKARATSRPAASAALRALSRRSRAVLTIYLVTPVTP